MSDLALQRIEAASRALDKVSSVSDAINGAAICDAAVIYSRRVGAQVEVVNKAVALKIRFERKAGEFLKTMEKQGPGDYKRYHDDTLRPSLSDIGVSRLQSSRWQKLAAIPEQVIETALANANDSKRELTTNSILKQAPVATSQKRKAEAKSSGRSGFVTEFSELAGSQFSCFYVDPPWRYSNQATRSSTDNHYPTLSVDEICAFPVKEVAANNAHLHLWTTNAFLFECPKIFGAWGFEFKSSFVWVKPQIGIGNYWRNSHEILLLAVKGNLTSQDKSLRSWGEFERRCHSAKPDQIRGYIENMSPGPRLEMFGRCDVPGWTVFGNEITEML